MLKEAFNTAFDIKAFDEKIKDYNLDSRGGLEAVGRIKTNASQEHRDFNTVRRKEKEKSDAFRRLLREQEEAERRLNDIFEQLEQKYQDLAEEEGKLKVAQKELNDLEEIKEDKDLDAAKKALEAKGIDTENMSDEQAWEAFDNLIEDKKNEIGQIEDTIDKIKEDIKKLDIEAREIIKDNFDPEDPKHQEYMNELNAIEERTKALNGNFTEIVKDIREETPENRSVFLQEKLEVSNKSIKIEGRNKFVATTAELASTDNDISEQASYDDPYGNPHAELKGKVVAAYNAVAHEGYEDPYASMDAEAGTSLDEDALDEALDNENLDSTLAATESAQKIPGLG